MCISGIKGGFAVNKEKYECTELDIIHFQTQDVITTSGESSYYDEYELPFIPNR